MIDIGYRVTKSFVMSHGREMCIGEYDNVPPNRVREICREAARNRGYPIRIVWGNPEWEDDVISHRSDEALKIRRVIRRREEEVASFKSAIISTISKKKRSDFRRKVKKLRSEIRRLQRQEKALT